MIITGSNESLEKDQEHRSYSDIINDGTDGFLAKNGDINDLTTKIEYLICNESLRSQIGIRAKQNIERYSPDAIMQQNILLYNKILNSR